jgi:tetratricopeptide (TPR) repeat protein
MTPRRLLAVALEWRNTILLLAVTAGVLAAGSWWREEPLSQDVGSHYDLALEAYRAGDFREAITQLGRAYAINGEDVGVNTLLGWSYWRLGDVARARAHFERALERDRQSLDAQTGLAFASLAQNDTATALPLLEGLAAARSDDRDVFANLAIAYTREGRNRNAAEVYRRMLRLDPNDQAARRDLLALFGYPEYKDDLSLDIETRPRPARFEQWFRTRGDYLEAFDGTAWRSVYLVGANLGPARPGEFPSTMSREFEVYAQWLREMAAMNANTVRIYTILPPAFYQALAAHNRTAATPLWLIQEVWVHDEAQDLYDPEIQDEFTTSLRRTIDLLHGQGDVPFRPGSQFGIYTADVSRWVIGLAVGREVEPHLALRTNARHSRTTSYEGRYVGLARGAPTEAWFARMCDLAVQYEMETYNTQRPLTVVNWPPLDPLTHSTESNFAEEVAHRQQAGEPVSLDSFALPDFANDSDVVSLDISKFHTAQTFSAGLFALYHVYQHWPDFLFHEPRFAEARDELGLNRYLGYLRALKNVHRNFPLVIGEYGLATSLGVAHLHPENWHNGGFTESGQAELLSRFTTNHWDTGAAGSIVFAWKDEWWKRVADHFTGDFEIPRDRDPLWFNVLDPEETFGLVGYEPGFPVPLLRGRSEDWERAERLAGPGAGDGEWRGLYGMADYAYLYLRLDVPRAPIDWARRNYWIALNTLPGRSGTRALPGLSLRLETGANFLVQLAGPGASRLLIAENYSPQHRIAVTGVPGQTRIVRKSGLAVAAAEASPFVEIVIEANQQRFGRDGTTFPAREYNRSSFAHGTADRSSPEFANHALWHANPASGMIELRIPWALILVTDPSSRQVFAGTDARGTPLSVETSGISVAVMAVTAGGLEGRHILSALPPTSGDAFATAPPTFAWPMWNVVESRQYFKPAYGTLRSLFGRLGEGPR